MESLIYFLLWAGLFLVMMRFGCGAHVMGHGRRHEAGAPSNGNAIDPVCGMTVAPATAKASVHGGRTYYFCSPLCREKFEAEPAKYLARSHAPGNAGMTREQSHGAHH